MKVLTKPELLAPAGSLEAFFAAMESGADAVYCGLQDYSARAKAKNFSLSDLERALAYARHRGRRIFVTVNTLVKDRELSHLAESLSHLETMGVDALIIQDMAVWRLVRDHFPAIPLHASTQMTIHNAAGVLQLERMGFQRAVLARELTLDEIRTIRSRTTLELEHFVHGALCFSFSGQCYFSSYLGGMSGNRGRCTQPCRRRYRYGQKDGYYFSPNDLSAIDLVPDLAAAGVMSFKIEGRMKSAEYVANVVSAYRAVIDAPPTSRREAVAAAKEKIKASLGRQPTRGFLGGPNPPDIANPSLKGATGRFLGEITSVRGSAFTLTVKDRLHVGDRLRIQPKNDKAGTAFTIKELRMGRASVKRAQAGQAVTVPSPYTDRFKVGDAVFKVSSEQAFTMSEAACRRRLSGAPPLTRPLDLAVSLQSGKLFLKGETAGLTFEQSYPVPTVEAESSPLSAATLHDAFEKTAEAPFSLRNLIADDLPPVVIPPSRLKEVRRDFYSTLAKTSAAHLESQRREHLDKALRAVSLSSSTPTLPGDPNLTVVIRDLRDAQILDDASVDSICLPLSPSNVHTLDRVGRRFRGREDRLVWDIPFILFDRDWDLYRDLVHHLAEKGYRTFRLNNLGHFPLFDGIEEARLLSGYRLFSLNTQALAAWSDLGITESLLYLEDDRENLRDLFASGMGPSRALTVYTSVPLITSRIPVRNVRGDVPVLSDRGEAFRISVRFGLTTVTPEKDFSLVGFLGELERMGCRRFVLDLTHCGPFSQKGKAVFDAFRTDRRIPGTSLFNYEGGME